MGQQVDFSLILTTSYCVFGHESDHSFSFCLVLCEFLISLVQFFWIIKLFVGSWGRRGRGPGAPRFIFFVSNLHLLFRSPTHSPFPSAGASLGLWAGTSRFVGTPLNVTQGTNHQLLLSASHHPRISCLSALVSAAIFFCPFKKVGLLSFWQDFWGEK